VALQEYNRIETVIVGTKVRVLSSMPESGSCSLRPSIWSNGCSLSVEPQRHFDDLDAVLEFDIMAQCDPHRRRTIIDTAEWHLIQFAG